MKLKDFVDFSFFDQENFEGVSDNETGYILCATPNIPYYLDHEIEHSKKDKKKCIDKSRNFLDFIDQAKNFIDENPTTKLKNNYLTDNDNFEIVHSVFYKSEPYYLFFLNLNYESDSLQFSITGLINTETNEYIFIGSDSEHYFIHTDTFTYADSSGIANADYFLIYPDEDDYTFEPDDSDSDENNVSESKYLTSKSDPSTIILAMQNTLEYLIGTMKQ